MRRLRFEERVERVLHAGAMRVERAGERRVVGIAHRLGDRGAMLGRARQRLRLLVVVVLQPVLEAAQEIVRGGERERASGFDEPALRERAQRPACGSHAQARVAAAAHHLQELHRELDLADAAGADLDVVGLAAADGGLEDARLQLAQLLEHPVVEVAPVHERLDALGHALGRSRDHASEVASGPLSPKGLRRMSTRNAWPSSVGSESSAMSARPAAAKNSRCETLRAPRVSPSAP